VKSASCFSELIEGSFFVDHAGRTHRRGAKKLQVAFLSLNVTEPGFGLALALSQGRRQRWCAAALRRAGVYPEISEGEGGLSPLQITGDCPLCSYLRYAPPGYTYSTGQISRFCETTSDQLSSRPPLFGTRRRPLSTPAASCASV
jgi:hypothetical protein